MACPRCLPLLACLAVLAGCTAGPNYHPPAVPAPPAFQEPAPQAAALPPGKPWWSVFNDPTLDGLEQQAVAANLDIRIAVTRIDQSDAVRRQIRSQELPQIAAQPNASRTREALNRPNNGNTGSRAATFNDYQLPLTLNYQIDAWGRIRRQVASAVATQQATAADLRFVQLVATAGVANSYYVLREADAESAVLQATLVGLRRGYQIVDNQFRRGLIDQLAPVQARTILDQTDARIATLHIQRDQAEHAVAVLLGRTVEGFQIPVAPVLAPPPAIPVGLPVNLLARRPDVIEAERYAAAASEQIGVAESLYFPQLSLTGFAGFESSAIGSLLTWQNTIANLAASAVAPLYTGGRLKAGVDQAKAAYQQSVLQYGKVVLISYQQVEDQLAALHYLADEFRSEQSAVADASRAERIADDQYSVGLVSYLNVVYAQQTLLVNQQTETQVQGQRLNAAVNLALALGGGW